MQREGSQTSVTSSSSSSSLDVESASGSQEKLLPAPPPYDYQFNVTTKSPHQAETRTTFPRFSSRRLATFALVVSLIALLCFAALLAFAVFWKKQLHAVIQEEQVCLPCSQVRLEPWSSTPSHLLEELEVRPAAAAEGEEEDGVDAQVCCARTAAQYAALFKLIIKRQEEAKRLSDTLRPAPLKATAAGSIQHRDVPDSAGGDAAVSAHFVLKPSSPVAVDADLSVQRWKSASESPHSHVRSGLRLSEEGNTITVVEPGVYFVYCQILYNRAEQSLSSSPSVVSSYVVRHSAAFPAASGILLKSRHTRPDLEQDRHSTYVGGLYLLHRGDQLFVRVSAPGVISHDDKASFFGLFKVGSE